MHDTDLAATTITRLREARDVLTTGIVAAPASAVHRDDAADLIAFAEPERRRHWPVVVGASAAAAACALAIAVVPNLTGTASGGASRANLSAADLSAAGGAKYTYLRNVVVATDGTREVTELWIPRKATGNWMYRHKIGTSKTQQLSGPCTVIRPPQTCSGPGNWKDVTPQYVVALPRNTAKLAALLNTRAHDAVYDPANTRSEQSGDPSENEESRLEVTMIQNILESGYADQALGRGLQTVLAAMPDVVVVHGARNGAGAGGTGYVVPLLDENGNSTNTEGALVFNRSGRYIGTTGSNSETRASTGAIEVIVPGSHRPVTVRPQPVFTRGSVFTTGTASSAGGTPTVH